MDGIINLHKPTGITSAKALYRVRAITRERKSGHAGTLDPGASGVLILCLGKATKLVERIMDQPKVYRARAGLGVTSESFDSDRPLKPVPSAERPALAEVVAAGRAFEGTIDQIPPAVSAIKIGGVPAYKRNVPGATMVLAPRRVTIYWLHVHAYDWPTLDFEVCCGRGTYIRAIIRDLGERLHTGGCLTSLARTQVGRFTLDDAWPLEQLSETAPDEFLIPMEQAIGMLAEGETQIPPRPAARPIATPAD